MKWGKLLGFLEYETFKVVKIKDRRIGVLYRLFQVLIFAYTVVNIVQNQGYLKKSPPVPGAIRVSLQAPPNGPVPQSYCNSPLPCVYWPANEILYPSDGAGAAFFTTRVSVTKYSPPGNCSFLTASSPKDPCFFNPNATGTSILSKSYVADIEDYTVMIEHSIRGQAASLGLRNGLMDGSLINSKGVTTKTWTNASREINNPHADGDILSIAEILDAAGANLDGPSTAPGANPGETYRSSGLVIVIVINYENVPFKNNDIRYSYYPQIIDGNEYKTLESIYQFDGSYLLKDRHGIRLVFQQYGEIGVFDPVSLILSLVAGFALFKVASLIVELLMLKILPERGEYEQWKFEESHDFDRKREEKKFEGSQFDEESHDFK